VARSPTTLPRLAPQDVGGRAKPGHDTPGYAGARVSPGHASIMSTTIAQAIRDGAIRLDGVAENPRLEARILLAHALGLTRNDLIRDPNRLVDTIVLQSLLARRAAHEPLALIVGHREFWSLEFQVSPATLIPRPDSETLIEAALAAFANRPPPRKILDLGTGTGCLLLALLKEFPSAFGIGLDLGPEAAALAKVNASHLGLAERSAFIAGDWTNPLSGRFDLIVSNPPYIAGPDIETLMPEVARHEPRRALDGGLDGYDAYRAILPKMRHHLEPGGTAILELGLGQAHYLTDLAREAGLAASLRLDLAGIPRAVVLTWPDR
jgi:release factor glutamine methyltransferase